MLAQCSDYLRMETPRAGLQ